MSLLPYKKPDNEEAPPPQPFGPGNPPVNADAPVEPEPEDDDDETGESA